MCSLKRNNSENTPTNQINTTCSISLPIYWWFMPHPHAWSGPTVPAAWNPFPNLICQWKLTLAQGPAAMPAPRLSPDLAVRVPLFHSFFPERLHQGHYEGLTLHVSASHWVPWELQLCCVNPYVPSVPTQYVADSENRIHWNRDLFKSTLSQDPKSVFMCVWSVQCTSMERREKTPFEIGLQSCSATPSFWDDYSSCSKACLPFADFCICWVCTWILLLPCQGMECAMII